MNLKNKKVWLLSALSFVLGAGLSAGVFYYKGQFNESSFERQAQNEALSETDDYKTQTQIKVAERTPQSKIGTAVKIYKGFWKRGSIGGNLKGAVIENSVLEDIVLQGKDCMGASFNNSQLIWAPRQARHHGYSHSAPFDISPLTEVDFLGASFQNTVIGATDLRKVSFNRAKMQKVRFETFDISPIPSRANPRRFYIYPGRQSYYWPEGIDIPENPFEWIIDESTDFSGAFLQGADLSELKDLHLAQLRGAVYNSQTKFPEGFNPKEHSMILRD